MGRGRGSRGGLQVRDIARCLRSTNTLISIEIESTSSLHEARNIAREVEDTAVKFFEFLNTCPHSPPDFLQTFHQCSLLNEGVPRCEADCPAMAAAGAVDEAAGGAGRPRAEAGQSAGGKCGRSKLGVLTVTELAAGQGGKVARIESRGNVRQRLLNLGILPDVRIELEHA